ncbi:unnamed protein product [Gongylonema pulchrum]|uniref:Acyl-CoA_dh_M domain-containing protein n=1 Tax=Gongylonema pulchrum TaxID=637853 RepID=A0A183D2Q9_9BILA|nr:unnamed protein product [Gongylonema pulchrum]
MATPALAEYGSNQLKREFLSGTLAGDLVACLGVSEACAGSDVAAVRTCAHWHGSDLIIDGSKQWITNGAQADWICLLANTNDNPSPHRNKSLICLRLNEPGIRRSKCIEKLGMHCSDTAEIYFDSVRVPSRNIIGEEGRGFVYQMRQFQDELLEPMQKIIDMTIAYTSQRRIFGKSVLDNQVSSSENFFHHQYSSRNFLLIQKKEINNIQGLTDVCVCVWWIM